MRVLPIARIFIAIAGSAAMFANLPAAAQGTGEETPYDLGYAHRASKACPNTELLIEPTATAQANADFAKGAAMFEHYLKLQSLDGACRAALSLYNSNTGKVAKILRAK